MLGKEAFAAFLPNLKNIKNTEKIEIDFVGVEVFSPSWGDEFLSSLFKKFKKNKIILKNTKNSSVKATLDFLEEINKIKYNRKN